MPISLQQVAAENDLVRRAYQYARRAHQGDKLKNGEPFFNHCLATAETLSSWRLDQATIAAGLLHHLFRKEKEEKVSDTVKREFNGEVANLIVGVNNIRKVSYKGTESKIDNLRKFILYLSRDIRVILIKLASRINTLQFLYAAPKEEQKKVALETIDIYAPLARQLGMNEVAGISEDLAFPYLYPEDYQWLITSVRDRYEERGRYLERFKPILKKELELNGVFPLRLDSRPKHYFSLYKKLLRYEMDFEQIYDLVAVRVFVKDLGDCYNALGIIHKNWMPLAGRIKDYIASPKPNGYRSLHTTVYTPEDKITEIQIRTQEMHDEAEIGIAAHFAYQKFKGTKSYLERLTLPADSKELAFIKELRQFPKRLDEISFFRDQILVLTPKGDVINLPKEATPVDFAYKIHTDLGNSCAGAKINGRITALNSPLSSGDVVEILTQKNKKPSASWLAFVKTTHARDKIKAVLNSSKSNLSALGTPREKRAEIKLSVALRPGLIGEVTEIFARSKIKIQNLDLKPKGEGSLESIKIILTETDKNKLTKLTSKLKEVKEIKKVTLV